MNPGTLSALWAGFPCCSNPFSRILLADMPVPHIVHWSERQSVLMNALLFANLQHANSTLASGCHPGGGEGSCPIGSTCKREILRCAQDDMREGPVHGMRT